MSTILAAVIQLAADVKRPRRRGWRCACEFEEVVSRDGERLTGVEIAPVASEEVSPGEKTKVTLRLWAALSRIPQPQTTVLFYEGKHQVASGIVGDLIENESQ